MYNTAKAALHMLTRALALEWACCQINVNAIAPGPIHTSATQERFSRPDYLERIINRVPLRHIGQPRDIALMAVYLASPASDFVTGQVFAVDGGRSIA